MKVRDILEMDIIKKGNQRDTIDGEDTNYNKAKRIAAGAKERAKDANPGESETVAQPHLGGHGSQFLNR